MAATYVTVTELRDALGIQNLYDDAVVEEVCQASEDLIKSYLWFNQYPVIGVVRTGNIATAILSTPLSIAVGQTVTITDCGAHFNGNHVITGTYPWSQGSSSFNWFAVYPFVRNTFPNGYSAIQWVSNYDDENYHLIVPYGKAAVTPTTDADYAEKPLVREASLMIAIDIWQARQQSNAGGISPDGSFGPSPYRMGNSLLSRVRGLLAPYLSPKSMVG